MTNFFKIALEFIEISLTEMRDGSLTADKSFSNQIFSVFGKGRDTTVSTKKRSLIDHLLTQIKSYTLPAEIPDDSAACTTLINLLRTYKDRAAIIAKANNLADEGSFGPGMERLFGLLMDIHNSLEEHKLLNIDSQGDSFTILLFYISYYLAQKVFDRRSMSPLTRLLINPNFSSATLIAQAKEDLLQKVITSCTSKLNALDSKKPDYLASREEFVMLSIKELLAGNQEICAKHGITKTVPIINFSLFASVSLTLPTLQPSSGFFESCMENALNEILSKKSMPAAIIEVNPSAACCSYSYSASSSSSEETTPSP